MLFIPFETLVHQLSAKQEHLTYFAFFADAFFDDVGDFFVAYGVFAAFDVVFFSSSANLFFFLYGEKIIKKCFSNQTGIEIQKCYLLSEKIKNSTVRTKPFNENPLKMFLG